MSVYGIRPHPTAPATPRPQPSPVDPSRVDPSRGDQARIDRHPGAPGTVGRPQPTAPAPGTQAAAALPSQAPAGTDPELWSVLTADERAFFAKVGAMGPLTYGRMTGAKPAAPPIALGGRIDVKA